MANSQKQDIDLDMTREEYGEQRKAVLQIHTGKSLNGGLMSDVRVFWVGDHSRSTMIFGDFDKRVHVSGREVKATQKAIDRQHAEVFTPEVVAELVAAAKLHYADKEVTA